MDDALAVLRARDACARWWVTWGDANPGYPDAVRLVASGTA